MLSTGEEMTTLKQLFQVAVQQTFCLFPVRLQYHGQGVTIGRSMVGNLTSTTVENYKIIHLRFTGHRSQDYGAERVLRKTRWNNLIFVLTLGVECVTI